MSLVYALEKEGITAFRFDFAGNGESEGAFQYGNYRREADGLQSVIQHFLKANRVTHAILEDSKVELTKLPLLEKLFLDNNKLMVLPPELGVCEKLKVLMVDCNMLVSVPVELRHVGVEELSLEHNKLIHPLLDFRAMAELRILRLSGNPLEFLPENLPLHQLRHLSLAKIRIVGDDYLRVNVQIELWESWGLLLIWSPKKCSARMDEIIEVIMRPHKDPEVQRLALIVVGNLAFCPENRRILVSSESWKRR
ncbi:Acyl transferase/acyl hydrolase/lysophospholipase [Artemisia annua]|uniref:Acyl transferase/acyl hydrolase/lysophospholipase n=1 Tax=Artemisia annua TaxID=35608 RepID=A0A2U1P268_ARTAN|nr:Acyl transferase/acyl hydrolase/lysophospholipase [Artemisia annua]